MNLTPSFVLVVLAIFIFVIILIRPVNFFENISSGYLKALELLRYNGLW